MLSWVQNKELFYQEMRNNSRQVRARSRFDKTVTDILLHLMKELCYLSDTARKEGLLDLEAAAKKDSVRGMLLGSELEKMIYMVCDGTDPELLENILMKKYYAADYSGLEGFIYLVCMDAMLDIQCGVHPWCFEWSLTACMPDEVIQKWEEEKRKETPGEAD